MLIIVGSLGREMGLFLGLIGAWTLAWNLRWLRHEIDGAEDVDNRDCAFRLAIAACLLILFSAAEVVLRGGAALVWIFSLDVGWGLDDIGCWFGLSCIYRGWGWHEIWSSLLNLRVEYDCWLTWPWYLKLKQCKMQRIGQYWTNFIAFGDDFLGLCWVILIYLFLHIQVHIIYAHCIII